MRTATTGCLAIALLAIIATGCGDSDPGGRGPGPLEEGERGISSLFSLPESLDDLADERFFDHPWPSDARLDRDGRPRFKGYPNPRGTLLLSSYVSAIDGKVRGFSPVASGFLRFRGGVDPASLPKDAASSILPTSSVQLIDVDGASPERGSRRLISLRYQEEEGVYWPSHTLSFMPTLGFPLRPGTRYALVVTDNVRTSGGEAMARARELDEVLGLAEARESARLLREAWAASIEEIERAGIARERIVHLAVFTTDDPTAELFAIRDHLRERYPAPKVDASSWKTAEKNALHAVYEGDYGPSPDYQHGSLPFAKIADGGDFVFENGEPIVKGDFSLRFVLSVPDASRCPMPSEGYPIVLHAHGTGGDYRSHLRSGLFDALSLQCLASMGVDQIFHGNRPGAPPDGPNKTQQEQLLFFNFENPIAARTNALQSVIDEIQRARLFTETKLEIPASVTGTEAIRFDGSKLMFLGHSQGGLNGPIYLAADDSARGGVLSGSGSMISVSLLEKTEPLNIGLLVKGIFLALSRDEQHEVDYFHPAISLAQTIVDRADPIHYVYRIVKEPRPGFSPKSVYQTEGVNADGTGDTYTPPKCIEVQAVATGLPLLSPVVSPFEAHDLAGLQAVTPPSGGLAGNLASGRASGALAQWSPKGARDGHFVIFDIPEAKEHAATFLQSLADDPRGKLPPR